jgi:hypothetical protein
MKIKMLISYRWTNIKPLIQLCLQTERDRGLSKNSIIELKRYLKDFLAIPPEKQCLYQVGRRLGIFVVKMLLTLFRFK